MKKILLVLLTALPLLALSTFGNAAGTGGLPQTGIITLSNPTPHWSEEIEFYLTVDKKLSGKTFLVIIVNCYTEDTGGNYTNVFYALDYGGPTLSAVLGGPNGGAYYSYNNWLTNVPAECYADLYINYHNGTPQEAYWGPIAEIEFDVEALPA